MGKECNLGKGNSQERKRLWRGEVLGMMGKYKVITLCGSTRFKDEFERVNKELTLSGHIVISVGCFGHAGDTFTEEQKVMLDDIHKQKIDMADGIFVINKDGYIGSSTRSEIKYAFKNGKSIAFLETPNPNDYMSIIQS